MTIRIFIVALFLLSGHINASEFHYLEVQPQLIVGKLENGGSFMNMRFLDFEYSFSKEFQVSGFVETGFSGDRSTPLSLQHAINRMLLKLTYRPKGGPLGFFVEGNYSSPIDGAVPNTYFTYSNYQAIGINLKYRSDFR